VIKVMRINKDMRQKKTSAKYDVSVVAVELGSFSERTQPSAVTRTRR
jgi:hypothetical protein